MNATRFWPRRSHVRACAGMGFGLAALIACGAPERLAVAPTILARPTVSATAKRAPIATPLLTFTETPYPTFTPETPYPTAPPVTPGPTSATPRETPTAPPTRVVTPVALPPAQALPLDQALAQVSSALLYTNRNGFLILADGQRELWLTADETICDRASSYQDQRGEWSPDGQYIAITCQCGEWMPARATHRQWMHGRRAGRQPVAHFLSSHARKIGANSRLWMCRQAV
jgi:hypothetical protein